MSAVFPIAYFGSVRYFQDLVRFKQVLFEHSDHFPKQTFRNRMVILGSQGVQILTMPLEKPSGSKTVTKDVLVSYRQNWPLIHWRALKTSYASAPYFEHYASDIEKILFKKHRFLVDFDLEITHFFLNTYQLPIDLSLTEKYLASYPEDYRFADYENLEMKGEYHQVLFHQKQFNPAISILDLLFCEGPMGRQLII
ncbi:WbqC family protein [Fluviicola chungangensis]|uniref:WbqC family protein n=1 Tax=Fluviicola chungangensis TaxID=2597671 RepID=A0A556N6N6_9FLAO|nr:WbqC family protein [Fluviicola chungangensis]TSJ47837.1 WbqC family protein [Fluviicola chungangensis]